MKVQGIGLILCSNIFVGLFLWIIIDSFVSCMEPWMIVDIHYFSAMLITLAFVHQFLVPYWMEFTLFD